jgi:hypothetical protein
MAYVNFAEVAAPAPAELRRERCATLSGLEWSVVALAKRDSMASLRTPGRVAKAMALLFGTETQTPIADPRLEALRRLAVHGWHRGFAVPLDEIRRFHAAGFSAAQLELVLTSISRDRAERRWRS